MPRMRERGGETAGTSAKIHRPVPPRRGSRKEGGFKRPRSVTEKITTTAGSRRRKFRARIWGGGRERKTGHPLHRGIVTALHRDESCAPLRGDRADGRREGMRGCFRGKKTQRQNPRS